MIVRRVLHPHTPRIFTPDCKSFLFATEIHMIKSALSRWYRTTLLSHVLNLRRCLKVMGVISEDYVAQYQIIALMSICRMLHHSMRSPMSANSPWNTHTVLGIFHPRPIFTAEMRIVNPLHTMLN